jgi:protein-disulfide isomerase
MFKITLHTITQRLRFIVAVLFAISFFAVNLPVYAAPISPELQNQVLQIIQEHPQQVLQIIQEHPQVVLDTLVSYQEQQVQAQSAQRTQILEEYRQKPAKLIEQSPTLGSRASGRFVIAFSDFQCPFCKQAYQDLQELHQRHPDLLIAYKNLPLVQIHDQAMPAAQAAWAAAQQGKFWEYHNQLFAQQQNLGDDLYQKIGQDLKLDLAKFAHDRQSDAALRAIKQDIKIANNLDAQGTPMFLVIGKESARILSGANIAEIEAALQQV